MTTAADDTARAMTFALMAHEDWELRAAGLNCLMSGAAVDAEALFRAGLTRHPADVDFRYRLASALLAQDRLAEGASYLDDALWRYGQNVFEANSPEQARQALTPADWRALGQAYYGQGQMAAAAYLYRRALEAQPEDLTTLNSLALTLMHLGRLDESTAAFQTVIRRMNGSPIVHSFLHFARVFQQAGPQTLFDEGRAWSALHERGVARRRARKPRASGRLRIGYFSPTFNRHQLTHFLAPALEAHDRSRFELYGYSEAEAADDVGRAIAAGVDAFRVTGGMSDESFCDRVEADGIDVLVDLWGHTAGNRLTAFAARPAPVQVSWLNYINTTGLTAFDAVLMADGYRTLGDQAWFSEPIRDIGPVIAPFRPFDDSGDPGPTPALAAGHYTFACAAHPGKINLDVVRTWSRILREAADARLELRYGYYRDPALRRAIVAMFESCGIGAERIVFPAPVSGAEFRRVLKTADLILDPFPYQGMTTTLDALEAGVPVLAWEGDYLALRIAPAALRACGLDELIASDLDAYVEKAVTLARDLAATSELRSRIRPAFRASPHCDAAGFTRRLEAAFEALAAEKA